MGTNQRQLNDIQRRLAELELIVKSGTVPRKELVKIATQVPKKITKDLSSQIREDYNKINEAIHRLDKSELNFPVKKQELIDLRKKVPYNYELSKELQKDIVDQINEILGVNSSNST